MLDTTVRWFVTITFHSPVNTFLIGTVMLWLGVMTCSRVRCIITCTKVNVLLNGSQMFKLLVKWSGHTFPHVYRNAVCTTVITDSSPKPKIWRWKCVMKKTKWQIWFLAILYHEKEIQCAIYGLRTNWSSTKGSVKDSSERHVLIYWQMITTLTLLADETVKEMNSVACRTSRLSQQVHGSFHQHQECFPPLLTSETFGLLPHTHDPSQFCYWSIFHKCLSVRHTSLHQIVSCGFDWQCCRRSD